MCTPLAERALRYAGSVATSVLPSPVAISAILPSCRTIPPMSCTSKWRMPSERRAASRQTANASGSTSSISAPPARRLRSSSVRERRAASSRACTGGSSTLISATTGIIRLTSRSCLVPKIFLRIAARRALEAEAYNAPAMIDAILKKIFGPKHERDVKRMMPVVAEINALEPAIQALDDAALRGKTDELRKRLADGAEVEAVLPEAFAVCREAARRSVGMRHFDVQLIGGMVLHNGTIAEMATGEGKTLVATLPAYLNALTGKGVHIVTVNDYLAKRDAQWM